MARRSGGCHPASCPMLVMRQHIHMAVHCLAIQLGKLLIKDVSNNESSHIFCTGLYPFFPNSDSFGLHDTKDLQDHILVTGFWKGSRAG